jgi:membrane protease YdiL (CAAX protease family)
VTLLFSSIGAIVNPFFEETIVVGYIVQSLERKNDSIFVISISAITRMGYHLYQGPIAFVAILPLGMLFAFTYWKWRSLWPLILAHGLLDFLALVLNKS